MKLKDILKQKKTGIFLVALGVVFILFIIIFFYINIIRIPGFPELLPVAETAAYAEFPTDLADVPQLKDFINAAGKINWDADVIPWLAEKGAVVFIKNNNAVGTGHAPSLLLPFVLLQVRSVQKAYDFLKNYRNENGAAKQAEISGITAFSTPALHFAFISDVLVISPSAPGLQTFLSYQFLLSAHLSSDGQFRVLRSAPLSMAPSPYFIYANPKIIPQKAFSALSQYVPRLSFLSFPFGMIGISGGKKGNVWSGTSYAVLDKKLPDSELINNPYGANLLPLLPPSFDLMVSGQNLASQIIKMENLTPTPAHLPELTSIISFFLKEYLPGIELDRDLAPLLHKEFAFMVNGSNVLFLAETDVNAENSLKKIYDSFMSVAPRFTPKLKELTLPDGKTKAEELVPDASLIGTSTKLWNGIEIKSIALGKKETISGAWTHSIWFVSNDLAMLKKSLQLLTEKGPNFRESAAYKTSLQPILQNPELAGVAVLPEGVFSFSKRTNGDRMETNWSFVLQ